MAMQQLKATIRGAAPMILKNGWTANPLNKFAMAVKEITSKKDKTEADHILLGNIEWLGCWYYADNAIEFAVGANQVIVGDYGELILPTTVLWGMIVNGAKKNKLGQLFKSGVFIQDDVPLEFKGKRGMSEMMADESLRIVTIERVGTARVVRTRPYLKEWSVTPTINYDDTVVNKAQIEQALEVAGRLVGLCERRPSFGRFTVEFANARGK
jgi:hypothetical protein